MCRPNALVSSFCHDKRHNEAWKPKRLRQNTSPGTLSPNARIKIKKAIRWLVASAETKKVYEKKYKRMVPWKINFATLTFHENLQDDKKARECLSRWLEVAKYRWKINSYIWKAEPQERGAIHFHACFNQYIPHQELRYTWNRELRKHGLANINDNSTDIHADTNINNTEAYLTDYFLNEEKHAGRRKINGKLWGCSHNLSNAGKQYLLLQKDEFLQLDAELQKFSLYEIKKNKGEPIPQWLQYSGYYILPNNYYQSLPECELKQQWLSEMQLLKPTPQPALFSHSII